MNFNQIFPDEKLALCRERLERFWHNDSECRTIIVPRSNVSYTNILDRDEARLKFMSALEHESRLGLDSLPAFLCVLGTPALASAFGGTWHVDENKMFWIDPVVNNPEDVYRLTLPPPMSGLVKDSVDIYRYAVADIDGYVPPRVPDMQGPLNTASMMWRQEDFILAMYDNPKEVHHLLSLVTDYIISVFRYFRDSFADAELVAWPPVHMPQQYGVGIIEDFTDLLSPDLYREFGLPYVNRIADEFGGVFVHCCARFKHHWDTFAEIHNLRGLDTMYPYTNPAEISARFPDIVHSVGIHHPNKMEEFGGEMTNIARFVCKQIPEKTRLIFLAWEGEQSFDNEYINVIKDCRKMRL